MSEPDGRQYDTDGEPLLWAREIAEMAGIALRTVQVYSSDADAARRKGADSDLLFPAPAAPALRTAIRGDGHRIAVWAKAYRQDQVRAWLAHGPMVARQPLTGDQVRAIEVTCPQCGVPAWHRCHKPDGTPVPPHEDRVAAAAKLAEAS